MKVYKGIVKWHGNHYFSGNEVSGSKIEHREDGTIWLYDDEENYISGIGGFARYEWVEIKEDYVEVKE